MFLVLEKNWIKQSWKLVKFPQSEVLATLASWGSCVCVLSHFYCVWLSATPWTVTQQAPLSVKFSMQEYWSGLTLPSAGDLPNQGSNLRLLQCIYLLRHQGSHRGSYVSYLFPSVTSGFSGWVVETRGMATSWAASPSPSCSSGRASSSAKSADFFLLLWCNPPSIRFPKLPVEPVARGEGPDVNKQNQAAWQKGPKLMSSQGRVISSQYVGRMMVRSEK